MVGKHFGLSDADEPGSAGQELDPQISITIAMRFDVTLPPALLGPVGWEQHHDQFRAAAALGRKDTPPVAGCQVGLPLSAFACLLIDVTAG